MHICTMEVCTPISEVPFGPAPDFEHDESMVESANHEGILRNSMISVRLSDNQSSAERKRSSEAGNTEPNKKNEHTRVRFEGNEISASAAASETTVVPTRGDEEPMAQDTPPLPALSSGPSAGEEFHPELPPSALHLRTGSIDSTCSSASSAHVDWEVLDKNEEQEQKDEGSDDVSPWVWKTTVDLCRLTS